MKQANNVNKYIASFSKEAQIMMKQLRTAIKSVAPEAKEKMSYGMAFYEYKSPGYKGRMAYIGAFKNHVSLFIVEGPQVNKVKGLKKYRKSKSALQFPFGAKIPVALVRQGVKAKMKEIDAALKKEVRKRI